MFYFIFCSLEVAYYFQWYIFLKSLLCHYMVLQRYSCSLYNDINLNDHFENCLEIFNENTLGSIKYVTRDATTNLLTRKGTHIHHFTLPIDDPIKNPSRGEAIRTEKADNRSVKYYGLRTFHCLGMFYL